MDCVLIERKGSGGYYHVFKYSVNHKLDHDDLIGHGGTPEISLISYPAITPDNSVSH